MSMEEPRPLQTFWVGIWRRRLGWDSLPQDPYSTSPSFPPFSLFFTRSNRVPSRRTRTRSLRTARTEAPSASFTIPFRFPLKVPRRIDLFIAEIKVVAQQDLKRAIRKSAQLRKGIIERRTTPQPTPQVVLRPYDRRVIATQPPQGPGLPRRSQQDTHPETPVQQ